MPGAIDVDKFPSLRHYASILGGVAASLTASLLAGAPTTPAGWLLLGLGSVVAALLLTLAVDRLLSLPDRPNLRAGVLPVVVGVALASGGVAVARAAPSPEPTPDPLACAHPVELRMLTSPDNLVTATALAGAYREATALTNQRCPTVNPYVYPVAAQRAIEALANGWSRLDREEVGPRPDIWLPDWPVQVAAVREEIIGGELASLDGETVVGSSPLVLAVPPETAVPEELSWAELPGLADDLQWHLVRPDPAASAVGHLANAALYGGADSDEDAAGRALQAEDELQQGLDEGGYPLAGPDALLCRHRDHAGAGAEPPVALIITEQALVRHNRADPLGPGCAVATDAGDDQPPAGPLVAHYPSGTVTMDQPVVPLTWQGQAPERTRAAADFVAWLSGPVGRPALAGAGLRPPDLDLADLDPSLGSEGGIDLDAVDSDQTSQPPTDAAVARGRRTYENAQRPGRVLLAVDVSGSMDELVDPDGTTRFDVAKVGVESALGLLGNKDELGLWVFPDHAEDRLAPRELVPIGSGGSAREQAAIGELGDETLGGGTPLYRTIVEGVAAVGEHDDLVTALVVLTDGDDTEDDPDIDTALEALGDEGVRVFVIAVGEASCRVAAIAGVTSRTNGECVQADFHTLEDQLVRVFGVLWSGR